MYKSNIITGYTFSGNFSLIRLFKILRRKKMFVKVFGEYVKDVKLNRAYDIYTKHLPFHFSVYIKFENNIDFNTKHNLVLKFYDFL